MDKVFLDANVLFSAAYRPQNDLLKLWSLPDIKLFTSTYALEEARRNLGTARQAEVLNQLLPSLAVLHEPPPTMALPEGVSLPVKDAPILRVAMHAKVTHLLTGDRRHFGTYFGRTVGGVLILAPAMYLRDRRVYPA